MKKYLSKREYEIFRNWLLNVVGIKPLPGMNGYELLRWQHHLPGKAMPICFRRDTSDKITLNGEAANYHKDFLRRELNARNVH